MNQSEDKLQRSKDPLPRYETLPRASAVVVKKVCQHLRLLDSLREPRLPNSQFSLEKRVTRHLNAVLLTKPGGRQRPPGEGRKSWDNYLDDARWGFLFIVGLRVDDALMASSGIELRGALRTADEALLRRALGLQIVAARILICLKNRDVREVKMSHRFNFKAVCEQL